MDSGIDAKNIRTNTLLEKLKLPDPLLRAAWLCTLVVFAAGFLAILGWVFDVSYFKSVLPGWQPMSFITAVCFMLLSAQLALILLHDKKNISRTVTGLPAVCAGIIGAMVVCIYALELIWGSQFHVNVGIDAIPALDTIWHAVAGINMYTAVLIIIFSSSLLLIRAGGDLNTNISHALALPAFFGGYLVIVSYILRVSSIHEFMNVRVAFNTGTGLCALGMGIFFLRPGTWFTGVFTGKNFGSIMMRRMLPGFMLLPVVIGWLRLYGERSGFFTSEVGVVAVIMAYTLCFLGMLWFNAGTINKADGKRRAAEAERELAEQKLQENNEELTAMNEELTSMNEELNSSIETQVLAEEELRRSIARFEMLSHAASTLLRSERPMEAVNALCHMAMKQLDCQVFFNFMAEDGSNRLRLNSYAGIPEEEAGMIKYLDNSSLVCALVARDATPIVLENIHLIEDPRSDLVRSFGVKAYACNPILGKGGKVTGTLSFGTKSRGVFENEDVVLMKSLTDEIAAAMIRMDNELELKRSHGVLEERVKERTAQIVVERTRLFDVMETLPVYVALLTAGHRLAYSNKFFRDRFGDDRESRCHQAMFKGAAVCDKCGIMDVLNTKKEHNWKWTGPDSREYDIYDFPFRDSDGTQQILEMGIDITDSKLAQEALLEAQGQIERAKRLSDIGTLASTVAHELRNPLATIGVAVYNIRRKIKDPELERPLANIEKKVKESDQIINNLLFYSRLKPPEREKVPIYNILKESADEVLARGNKGVLIAGDIAGLKDIVIDADPTQLREVFNNLLNNAHEAVPKGGRIDILGVPDRDSVKIMVRDNGTGIEKEILEKAFDPFFTTKARGTGLGLSVCRQIISSHNGSIWLESEPGKGTKAHVTIPMMEEQANA